MKDTEQDCRACDYFVGCECFDGKVCKDFKNEKGKQADRRRKLTEEQRAEIIKLYREGATQCSIAKKYGVSNSTIGLTVNPRARVIQRERQKAWYLRKCKKILNRQRDE